jgi:pimeloyl-ACP methyl ester carboxylesterase
LSAAEPTRARYPDDEGFVDGGDGVRVFYEVYGDDADTICLLQPWPLLQARTWRPQIAYLSRHFRVLAIDPRGNGRSDRPRDPSAYSRRAHVGDVLAVLEATGTERAMLASISPRGPLTLELAIEHPDRVRAAAFITPQLWAEPDFVRPFTAGRRDRYDGYDRFNPSYWRRDYGEFVDWFARTLFPHPHSTRQIEELVRHALETDGETLIAATVGFEMYERDEALRLAGEIQCPVLVTQNGGGAFWAKECSGPLAEASGGRLHIFEGLGPGVASRWPVAMNLVLRDFFESVRAPEREGRGARREAARA